jgi:hypothetical protein
VRAVIFKYVVYFLALILAQVLVLNNMQISSYLNPYIYVLFILILPFETPGWLLIVSGFLLGFTMDLFPQGFTGEGSTLGFHTAATVFMAFCRPIVLKWINPRDEYEPGSLPRASDNGFLWYLLYSFIMVGGHHFVLFSFEAMSFSRFPEVVGRTILSTLFSVFLILLWEGFNYKRR